MPLLYNKLGPFEVVARSNDSVQVGKMVDIITINGAQYSTAHARFIRLYDGWEPQTIALYRSDGGVTSNAARDAFSDILIASLNGQDDDGYLMEAQENYLRQNLEFAQWRLKEAKEKVANEFAEVALAQKLLDSFLN